MRSLAISGISLLLLSSFAFAQQANNGARRQVPMRQASNTPANDQQRATTARQQSPVQNGTGAPFQLNAQEQQRVDQLLTYWEHKSKAVKTYSCRFMRYEYDAVFGPKNPKHAKTVSEGLMRFAAPDKGEFRVEKVGEFQPPQAEGQKPQWPMKKVDSAEHWICDGQSVFELNGKKKQLIQRELPPEMRGRQIADGPLPFMFGAEKKKLLQRYWIRELVPPKQNKGQYWLEAWPKLAENRADFMFVQIILDEKEFLPQAIQIFPPNYHPRNNNSRTAYNFADRKANHPLDRGQQFLGAFISPKTPIGWKKIVERFEAPASEPVAQNASPGQPGSVRK